MSPQLRGIGFTGPQQQRGAIGLMAAVTLGMVLLFMLLVVDSGRLYLEQRKLQRVADMAVLEAVSRGGNCTGPNSADDYVKESAARNGFIRGGVQQISPACGTLEIDEATQMRKFTQGQNNSGNVIQVIATTTVPTSVARGLWSMLNAKFDSDTNLTASAVGASSGARLAQLTIRSTLLEVSDDKSKVLNLLWGKLLGGELKLTAAGWQGLADTKINLLSYLDLLNNDLKLNALSYDQVLKSNIHATDLIDIAIKTLTNNNTKSSLATSGLLEIRSLLNSTTLKLGDIIKIQTDTDAAGLDTTINVFQLVEAYVQLANISNGLSASIPVTIPGIANGMIKVKIIQPPQLSAIGDPEKAKRSPDNEGSRIYVRTAQVRTGFTLTLPILDTPAVKYAMDNLVGPLTNTLNSLLTLNLSDTIKSLFCLILAPCKQTDLKLLPIPSVNIVLEVASANSRVKDYSCASETTKTLTVENNAAISKIKLGDFKLDDTFSPTKDIDIKPLPLVDIGSITCTGAILSKKCDPATRVPFYGGGIGLKIDSDIGTIPDKFKIHTYNKPPNIGQPPLYYTSDTTGLTTSLNDALTGVQLDIYRPVNSNTLGRVLDGVGTILNDLVAAVVGIIGDVLGPVIDRLLEQVFSLLGISLNVVDVGANLSCGQVGRAQLVL